MVELLWDVPFAIVSETPAVSANYTNYTKPETSAVVAVYNGLAAV